MALQETFEKEGNFLFRYRSFLPLVILISGIFVFIKVVQNNNLPTWIPYSCIEYTSLLISFLGLFIRIIAVGHTPANTSGRNTKQQLADEVNTTGIYSLVRHPLYLGNFFMWLGTAILVANGWFILVFALSYWLYYERIMYAEEQFLRSKFGRSYLEWANITPAFIPSLKGFRKSAWPFSLKKVIKKEKNGIAAVFLLVFIFHNIAYSIENQEISIDYNWLLVATIVAVVLYFVLKLLKRYTEILEEKGR